MQKTIFTLRQFNYLVRSLLETGMPDSYLITAEVASLRFDQKGHCYLELVDRDDSTIVAQMRAVIWSSQYRVIARQFRMITGQALAKGMKILVEAGLSFHERYGLNLAITDIDPSYTMGEMSVRRKEILDRLDREGLLEKNKKCEFPLLPLKIAVISSPGAAGYGDFREHIRTNHFGYRFEITLFSARMQGDSAEESIVKAFSKCSGMDRRFDIAVIIRGGGAEADLHCFDNYQIGRAVAGMDIPVVSGIGHERDRTVVDEVAHTSVKTPTAAAELIIRKTRDFHLRVIELETALMDAEGRLIGNELSFLYRISRDMERNVSRFLALEGARLNSLTKALSYSKKNLSNGGVKLAFYSQEVVSEVGRRIRDQERRIGHIQTLMQANVKNFVSSTRRKLFERETVLNHLDPENVLRRGYSITFKDGRPVRDAQELSDGDIIKTTLYRGTFTSRITGVEKNGEKKAADL